jgi:hypothetical protein
MTDALGQPIVFGTKYGYSTSSSGIGNVVVGVAIRETKTKITLDVISRTEYCYGRLTDRNEFLPGQMVSVQSYHLFPVKD